MRVDYIARKVTLDDDFRQLTEKKLAKITKYFNDILDMRVEVSQERHLHVVDIFVKGKDFDIKSTTQHKELNAAIQEAVDAGYILLCQARPTSPHCSSGMATTAASRMSG